MVSLRIREVHIKMDTIFYLSNCQRLRRRVPSLGQCVQKTEILIKLHSHCSCDRVMCIFYTWFFCSVCSCVLMLYFKSYLYPVFNWWWIISSWGLISSLWKLHTTSTLITSVHFVTSDICLTISYWVLLVEILFPAHFL